MTISSYPPAVPKRVVTTLTSGTSWTVPSGVTQINVTLRGGGGSGGSAILYGSSVVMANPGCGGQVVTSNLSTTPGASITYAIGAGGTASTGAGASGGTTTFTGATSAVGGSGGSQAGNNGNAGTASLSAANGGRSGGYSGTSLSSGAGGAGSIDIEYWV